MSVTRISSALAALALCATWAATPGFAAREVKFTSPQAAFEHGMGALKAGHFELALPALEHASAKGVFLAQFYLARVFADNTAAYTDHAKAYMLYQRIADEHADIDPDVDQRAPFVAKAITALAGYLKHGIPEIGLRPNPLRAADYLHHAATFFNDQDAQFELAKLYLKGEGVPLDLRRGIHWLSVLTERGHAGAQAFLANLYWQGQHVPKDPLRAVALITVAAENAPAHERIWIEDIHQNIFCGATEAMRSQAAGLATDWRRRYGRPPVARIDQQGLALLPSGPVRTCSDGQQVPLAPMGPRGQSVMSQEARSTLSTSSLRAPEHGSPATIEGNVLGFSLRDATESAPATGH